MALESAVSVPSRSRLDRRRYDGRSSLAVRVRVLAKVYTERLGGAASDPAVAASIRRCAELEAIAEQLRADAIRTGNLDPFAMARAENLAARAKRALGLDKPPAEPPLPPAPSLESYRRKQHESAS